VASRRDENEIGCYPVRFVEGRGEFRFVRASPASTSSSRGRRHETCRGKDDQRRGRRLVLALLQVSGRGHGRASEESFRAGETRS